MYFVCITANTVRISEAHQFSVLLFSKIFEDGDRVLSVFVALGWHKQLNHSRITHQTFSIGDSLNVANSVVGLPVECDVRSFIKAFYLHCLYPILSFNHVTVAVDVCTRAPSC